MKHMCLTCHSKSIRSSVQTRRWLDLPNSHVYVEGVKVETCKDCGDETCGYDALADLIPEICRAIEHKRAMSLDEVEYCRKVHARDFERLYVWQYYRPGGKRIVLRLNNTRLAQIRRKKAAR